MHAAVAFASWSAASVAATMPVSAQEAASVAVVDDRFQPAQLTVDVGSTVTWTNRGRHPHTVTADDRAFDSGTLDAGQTFSVTFDQAGRVSYYCQVHGEPGSGMVGLVIVRAAPGAEAPGSDVLARTGVGAIPLGLASLTIAIGGLTALRVSRSIRRGGG